MRFCVLLLLFCCFFASSPRGYAQDQSRPFIKISHIGAEALPLFGAFISTRKSELDEKLELTPGYRSEPVYLVSKSEFAALLGFARRFAAQAPNVAENTTYGTFQLTFSDGQGSDISIATAQDDSLRFLTELIVLLDGFGAANRRVTELREALQLMAGRLTE